MTGYHLKMTESQRKIDDSQDGLVFYYFSVGRKIWLFDGRQKKYWLKSATYLTFITQVLKPAK